MCQNPQLPDFQNYNFQPVLNQPTPIPQRSYTEELLETFLMEYQKNKEVMEQQMQRCANEIEQMRANNAMLENQIAQQVAGYEEFPSRPEPILEEEFQAIPWRCGEQVEAHIMEPALEQDEGKDMSSQIEEGPEQEELYAPPPSYLPSLPFPQRVQDDKLEEQIGKFISTLQKFSVSVPFIETLNQMPSYAMFLQDLLSNKQKLEEYGRVALTSECSAVIQNMRPPKLNDPGSFSIPCLIGKMQINRAVCDFGASVNLLPLAIWEKLELGDPKPTTMFLQLADQSIKYPVGIVEDIPVQIGKFFIPIDFVVLEMEGNLQVPILGNPFLATAGAILDIQNERLTLEIGDERIEFNIPSLESDRDESGAETDMVDPVIMEELTEDPFNEVEEAYKVEEESGQQVELQSAKLLDTPPTLLLLQVHKSELSALFEKSSQSKERASQVKFKPLYSKYQKFCALPGTFKNTTRWALRFCKPDLKAAADKRHLRLNE